MNIKILGSGCKNCKKLEAQTKKAVEELGVEAVIEKVEDFKKIMKYGVMQTPALVVDEEVKVSGKIPKIEEIKEYIR